jgi:DNA polymerase III epsilon subunit-like protein
MITPFQYVLFDIEANGFKPSEIFCISMIDLLSLEERFFAPADIPEGLVILGEAKMVVGHYIRGYDCPVIERLTDGAVTFPEDVMLDTLDMSKALSPSKKHSLAWWGDIFGLPKMKSPLFERYTPQMKPYCIRDMEINLKVFLHLIEKSLDNPEKRFRNDALVWRYIDALNEYAKEVA